MTARPSAEHAKILRRTPRHQQLSELAITYEGSRQILRIHPPNLSSKGMFINTGVTFPEGSILKVSFRLARTGVQIATRCEVRYCVPGAGLGVQFVGLSPADARAIDAEIGGSAPAGQPADRPQRRPRKSR